VVNGRCEGSALRFDMPTIFTHAVAATSLAVTMRPHRPLPTKWWCAAALCSMVPDADVIAFRFGIPYAHMFGHRGFSHSIALAALLATFAWLLLRSDDDALVGALRIWTILFLSTASHGVLDAMTSGGLGVAFFSPFSNHRYFFDWRPIIVAPIGVARFFSERGLAVLKSEFAYVWLPSVGLIGLSLLLRKPKAN
jgi:inner membrane protein